MVCQNCQSKDIVEIQGQPYCLNCGSLVTSKPSSTPAKPKPGSVVAPKVAVAEVTPQPAVAPIINHSLGQAKAPAKPVPPKAAATSLPEPTASYVKPSQPKPPVAAMPSVVPTPSKAAAALGTSRAASPKHFSDISPRPKPKPTPASAIILPPEKEPVKTVEEPWVTGEPALGAAVGAGLKALFAPRYLKFSIPAAISALALAASLYLMFYLPNQLVAVVILAVTVLALWTKYLWISYAELAISYGASHAADRRKLKRGWSVPAWSSFWAGLWIDVWTAVCLALLVVAAWALYRYIALANISWFAVQVGLVTLGYLALIYLTLGVLAAKKLARLAVLLGGLPARQAIARGWSLYLAGFGSIIAAGLVATLFSGVLALGAAYARSPLIHSSLSQRHSYATWALLAVTASLLLAALFNFNTVFWVWIYRLMVRENRPQLAAQLLGGRKEAAMPRRASLSILTACLLVYGLGAASIYYRQNLAQRLPATAALERLTNWHSKR